MTSTILALASLVMSSYIALAMKMPLTAEDSSSLGSRLMTAMNRRQPFDPGNAVASRQRRSPRQDDSSTVDSKYGAPQGQKYDGVDGPDNQLAKGPFYNDVGRGYAGDFDSLGGGEIPLMSERSFDSLGGGEVPWMDRRAVRNAGHSRIHERAFDTLGGGEIPWFGGKRARQRK